MKQLITILLQNANLDIKKIGSIESINRGGGDNCTATNTPNKDATTSSISNTIFDTAVDETSYCSCSIKSTVFYDDHTNAPSNPFEDNS